MRNLIVMTVLLASLAGCWAVTPQLHPHDPPPNVPAGMLLLEIPADEIEAMGNDAVFADRDRALVAYDADRARQIREHQLVTGMTAQEAIWVFASHPTRVADQGPPGGHTLLWQVPRGLSLGGLTVGVSKDGSERGNYWVRIDEWGRVVAAGRN